VQQLPYWSLRINPQPDSTWQQNWTLFYWSWWISWSPFVGIFVARISYGRTLRQIVLNVLFVPTLVTFLWLSVVGGTGLHLEYLQDAGIAEAVRSTPAIGLHRMLEELPLGAITSVLATLLIIIFFITSSDSGSLVDDMVTSGGHPHPPRAQRVFWAVSEGTVAATLLYAGGLQALRTASLQSGLPMAILLLLSAVGLKRTLDLDRKTRGVPKKDRVRVTK
jgi:choline/glycine/proline betaine transport protein